MEDWVDAFEKAVYYVDPEDRNSEKYRYNAQWNHPRLAWFEHTVRTFQLTENIVELIAKWVDLYKEAAKLWRFSVVVFIQQTFIMLIYQNRTRQFLNKNITSKLFSLAGMGNDLDAINNESDLYGIKEQQITHDNMLLYVQLFLKKAGVTIGTTTFMKKMTVETVMRANNMNVQEIAIQTLYLNAVDNDAYVVNNFPQLWTTQHRKEFEGTVYELSYKWIDVVYRLEDILTKDEVDSSDSQFSSDIASYFQQSSNDRQQTSVKVPIMGMHVHEYNYAPKTYLKYYEQVSSTQ